VHFLKKRWFNDTNRLSLCINACKDLFVETTTTSSSIACNLK